MTGIFLLFAVVLWLVIAYWLTKLITIKLPKNGWRILVRALLFFVLLPLPLADEIVGKRQFEQLCKERAASIKMDREKVRGQTVYYDYVYPTKVIRGKVTNDDLIADRWIPIWQRSIRYLNVSGEEVISYKELRADGGWIARGINFNSTNAPYTFEGFCRPRENIKELFKSLQITVLDRPNTQLEGKTK